MNENAQCQTQNGNTVARNDMDVWEQKVYLITPYMGIALSPQSVENNWKCVNPSSQSIT